MMIQKLHLESCFDVGKERLLERLNIASPLLEIAHMVFID